MNSIRFAHCSVHPYLTYDTKYFSQCYRCQAKQDKVMKSPEQIKKRLKRALSPYSSA